MKTALTNWRELHGDFFHGAKALVTGGAGFIGSHLIAALDELGAVVTVIDDLSGGDRNNMRAAPRATLVEGTILDAALLDRCADGCGFVFHLAALGSVPHSVERPRAYHDVNVTGTFNVLEAARKAKARRVMFAASSAAYGDSEVLPKIETMPVLAKSPYAANKVAAEAMMRAWSGSLGLDTASLRYFNIFGPRQNANSAYAAVIAGFAKALLNGKNPTIFGDGEQSRDFTYVDNAVHANLLAARSSTPIEGEVINVACGDRVTVNQLAVEMAKHFGRPDLTAIHAPPRAGDVKHSQADISHARKVLNYEPIVGFEQGLKATLDWYQADFKP